MQNLNGCCLAANKDSLGAVMRIINSWMIGIGPKYKDIVSS